MRCLEKYDTLKVALFVEEETGCKGSMEAKMDFFKDCRFVIQPDRRGYKDLITSIGWTDLCSDEFLKAIGYEKFGYQETEGLFTDVLTLKENGVDVSCINLSCGYYEPHTNREFTVKKDLLNCQKLVEHIIENCTDVYPHSYSCDATIYNTYRGNDKDHVSFWWEEEYEEAVNEIFSMLDMDDTLNVDDLECMYGLYFSHLKREDYERIYLDYYELRKEDEDYGKQITCG